MANPLFVQVVCDTLLCEIVEHVFKETVRAWCFSQ